MGVAFIVVVVLRVGPLPCSFRCDCGFGPCRLWCWLRSVALAVASCAAGAVVARSLLLAVGFVVLECLLIFGEISPARGGVTFSPPAGVWEAFCLRTQRFL